MIEAEWTRENKGTYQLARYGQLEIPWKKKRTQMNCHRFGRSGKSMSFWPQECRKLFARHACSAK